MAILRKGIYSMISGKLGDFFYYSVDGQTRVKTAPDPEAPKKEPSPAQLANREKFRLVAKFLSPFAPVLELGFRYDKRKISPKVKAFKVNYPVLVRGVYPNMRIDYEKLQLSSGHVFRLHHMKMVDEGGGLFGLSWKCCADLRSQDDLLVLVLYEEGRNRVVYCADLAKVIRQQAEFEVCQLGDCKVHAYVFTISKDKRGNSESQYLGLVA